MAKRVVQTDLSEILPDEEADVIEAVSEPSPGEQEEMDIEQAVINEFGRSADDVEWRVSVRRAPEKGSTSEPICFDCQPSDFPIIERIRLEHGPGKYRIRVFKNGRVWRYFQIEIDPRKDVREMPRRSEVGDMTGAIAQMMEKQNQFMERLVERISTAPQATESRDTVGIMSSMMSAMMQMKEFIAPKTDGLSADKILDVLKTGMEFAKNSDSETRESSILDIVRDLIRSPILEKAMEQQTMTGAMPGAMPMRPPMPPTPGIGEAPQSVSPPIQPNPQPAPDQAMIAAVQNNLKYLCGIAQRNGDAELYADWAYDNFPLELIQQLCSLPNALEVVGQIAPDSLKHRAWFETMLSHLRRILTDDGVRDDSLPSQDDGDHVPGSTAPASNAYGTPGR